MSDYARLILIGFMSLFFFGGLAIIIVPFIILKKKKAKFDCVSAKCIRIDTKRDYNSDGNVSITFLPVWEYWYQGETKIAKMNYSASYLKIPVGMEKEIYVNPDNPSDILVVFAKDYIFTTVFGACWSIFSLIITIIGF